MQKIYRKEANIYAELLIYDIMQFLFAIVLAKENAIYIYAFSIIS